MRHPYFLVMLVVVLLGLHAAPVHAQTVSPSLLRTGLLGDGDIPGYRVFRDHTEHADDLFQTGVLRTFAPRAADGTFIGIGINALNSAVALSIVGAAWTDPQTLKRDRDVYNLHIIDSLGVGDSDFAATFQRYSDRKNYYFVDYFMHGRYAVAFNLLSDNPITDWSWLVPSIQAQDQKIGLTLPALSSARDGGNGAQSQVAAGSPSQAAVLGAPLSQDGVASVIRSVSIPAGTNLPGTLRIHLDPASVIPIFTSAEVPENSTQTFLDLGLDGQKTYLRSVLTALHAAYPNTSSIYFVIWINFELPALPDWIPARFQLPCVDGSGNTCAFVPIFTGRYDGAGGYQYQFVSDIDSDSWSPL